MGLNVQDLAVTSPDIRTLGEIPAEFAAETGNRVPRVEISGVPEGAVELAVMLHDPDAPLPHGFTHWVVYGIDPATGDVDAGRVGPNGIGAASYSGPQPPHGHGVHHYYFWVYALSQRVKGEPSREEFLERYAGAIVEQNRFVGTFQR